MNAVRRHQWAWLALALLLIVAGCGAGLWVTPLGDLPRYRLARERWDARDIRHYQMTVQLTHGWIDNGPWTLEVRDGQVLAGYDTATRAPLSNVQLRLAQLRAPVGALFAAIRDELRFSSSPSTQIARMVPPLRHQLDRCAANMPHIAYDPALGYPRSIVVYASPCFIQADWTISVLNLTPLP
jgi:hypothetical protein